MTSNSPPGTLVTVSGAAGFIALHCIRELLAGGYRVRGTLRDLSREPALRRALGPLGDDARLCFTQADLSSDDGWQAAMTGATYALHVASPLPNAPPKHEDELIRPAREGALRALRAAHAAGVERVVMTSSVAAVFSGRKRDSHVFDENDWSDLNANLGAYAKSKTIAERAAWEFVDALPSERGLELVCINPGFVLGPSLSGANNTSNEIVRKLVRKEVPGVPRLHLGLVDVRDVAHAHLLAMTTASAKGQRFILVSETVWMKDIADTLAAAGYDVPRREVPNWLVHVVALFDKTVRLALADIGQPFRTTSERAKTVLGWSGRPMQEMVLDTARAILQNPGSA